MFGEYNSIFDIVYSLPVVAHSVAILTRSPTAGYGEHSRYMPDYGGILENHKSKLKNNALGCGFSFRLDPIRNNVEFSAERIATNFKEEKVFNSDPIAVSSFLNQDCDSGFSLIHTYHKSLFFDKLEETDIQTQDTPNYITTNYEQVSFPNVIHGLKHSDNLGEFLLARFSRCVKVIKLNRAYSYPQSCAEPVYRVSASITDNAKCLLEDVSLNPLNKSSVTTASESGEICQLKFYDLNSNLRPYQTVNLDANLEQSAAYNSISLRTRMLRTFTEAKPSDKGIKQIDNIPSHLVNLLATTRYQTLVVDPRANSIGLTLVDKNKIASFYPCEFLRRSGFSHNNSYQWYSLSNIHLRVFDTRFPNSTMNQINHMLDSDKNSAMNLQIIPLKEKKLEIVSASSLGRVCFTSFDQSSEISLVNPTSTHAPYHEYESRQVISDERIELTGLSFRVFQEDDIYERLFAIFQLNQDGNLVMSQYKKAVEDVHVPGENQNSIRQMISGYLSTRCMRFHNPDLEERDILDDINEVNAKKDYMNIYDLEKIELEEHSNSRRALDRFEKMKAKLEL